MRSLHLCLFFPVLFATHACREEASSVPPAGGAVSVRVAPVELRELSDTTIAVGTLKSEESVDLSSNVTERVESIHFDDGDEVKKGQLLAQLVSDEEHAVVEMVEAELAEEEREITRLEVLAKRDAVALVTLDERRTRGEIAQGKLAQTKAMLADRRIVAPFDGVVGLRRISPGALAEPGMVITTIDQIDPMKLDFQVPEIFLNELPRGTSLLASSAAFPDESFEATVENIDPRIDPVTRALTVRARIPNRATLLRPGMLMTVELRRNRREALVIPERAVVPVGGTQSVYRLDDGTVSLVEVKTGARIPGYVEIIAGVSEGQQVVTDGVLSLRNGSAVEVAGPFEGTAPAFDPTNSQ